MMIREVIERVRVEVGGPYYVGSSALFEPIPRGFCVGASLTLP
jgi:hypothetical protein